MYDLLSSRVNGGPQIGILEKIENIGSATAPPETIQKKKKINQNIYI
jgi:hypothetical protein